MTTFYQDDTDAITELLMGRQVTKVSDAELLLDNGTVLRLEGNDGGCACSAGCYDLTELNGCDNVITRVEFRNDPDDDYSDENGVYQIFVYADNQKINLATFEGSDGNGYYGTGYSITVTVAGGAA